MSQSFPLAFVTVTSVTLLAGCAITSPVGNFDSPATTLGVVGLHPPIDQRARYRQLFCDELAHEVSSADAHDHFGEPCDTYLWRLPVESGTASKPSASAHPMAKPSSDLRPRVLIVGGAFSDCFPPASTPFAASVERLRQEGFAVDYVPIEGRSSSKRNSEIVAAGIAAVPLGDARPLVLIGYSKGTADILETLIRRPELARRVAAVVAIAGAVNGSPLADRYSRLYGRLFSSMALGSCPAGDGGVLRSLKRDARLGYLAQNPLPDYIKYYSVGTFTTSSRLARALKLPQRQLSQVDPRNDGQLLVQDEVIPGSALLGYVNADHWSVALQMEDRFSFWAHRKAGKHLFPQQVLLESVLELIREDLDDATE